MVLNPSYQIEYPSLFAHELGHNARYFEIRTNKKGKEEKWTHALDKAHIMNANTTWPGEVDKSYFCAMMKLVKEE